MKRTRRPNTIKDIIWLSFSEADDRYLDLFRIGYAMGLLAFIVYSGYTVFGGAEFDPVAWGSGFAAILFGGGVGVGLRGRLEDGVSPSTTNESEGEDHGNS